MNQLPLAIARLRILPRSPGQRSEETTVSIYGHTIAGTGENSQPDPDPKCMFFFSPFSDDHLLIQSHHFACQTSSNLWGVTLW